MLAFGRTLIYVVEIEKKEVILLLWPRYIADADIIFLLCGFFFLSTSLSIHLSFFSSNLIYEFIVTDIVSTAKSANVGFS